MALEFNDEQKLLKFKAKPLLQQIPSPFNASCVDYNSEEWQMGLSVQVGNSTLQYGSILVLND
jgi:hypothetical protein